MLFVEDERLPVGVEDASPLLLFVELRLFCCCDDEETTVLFPLVVVRAVVAEEEDRPVVVVEGDKFERTPLVALEVLPDVLCAALEEPELLVPWI